MLMTLNEWVCGSKAGRDVQGQKPGTGHHLSTRYRVLALFAWSSASVWIWCPEWKLISSGQLSSSAQSQGQQCPENSSNTT
jgi:hypothetical protein